MSKPDTYYPDGMRHGAELPDDTDLDQMLYPERPPAADSMAIEWTPGMSYEEFQAKKDRMEHEREERNNEQDRRFEITLANKLGTKTGPPRTA